ncbi:MAG: rhodanese-like domain-containing protein [Pseudomonadota bacterium]
MNAPNNKLWFLLPLLWLLSLTLQAAEEFPVRAIYPKVEPIELETLYQQREQMAIFDVRSGYEYQTLHIKGARHLALDDPDFVEKLRQLREQESSPFVFYCNGHTCKKSYKATQRAMHADIDNVYVFDAGIFAWTQAHPDEAVLLGNTPVDPAKLLNKEKLQAHMLEPEEFGERASDNSIILDIRDTVQKNAISLFPMRQRSVPLDNNELQGYVEQAKRDGKTLLIYDAVGKQVRWLQYFLEEQGLRDYYFMKGGAQAFLGF